MGHGFPIGPLKSGDDLQALDGCVARGFAWLVLGRRPWLDGGWAERLDISRSSLGKKVMKKGGKF
jgi:hypothetical protein